jgi:hypothetical protein
MGQTLRQLVGARAVVDAVDRQDVAFVRALGELLVTFRARRAAFEAFPDKEGSLLACTTTTGSIYLPYVPSSCSLEEFECFKTKTLYLLYVL